MKKRTERILFAVVAFIVLLAGVHAVLLHVSEQQREPILALLDNPPAEFLRPDKLQDLRDLEQQDVDDGIATTEATKREVSDKEIIDVFLGVVGPSYALQEDERWRKVMDHLRDTFDNWSDETWTLLEDALYAHQDLIHNLWKSAELGVFMPWYHKMDLSEGIDMAPAIFNDTAEWASLDSHVSFLS